MKMLKKISLKEKIEINAQGWFLFAFSLWNVLDILQGTTLESVLGYGCTSFMTVTNWIVLGMLLVHIIRFQRYDGIREIVCLAAISVIVVLSTVLSQNNIIMSLWLFIIASRDVGIDECVERAYRILLIILPLVIVLHLAGILPEIAMYRNWNWVRHSLGFSHPNTLGMRAFQLVAYHFYLRRNRLDFRDFLFLIGMEVFIYFIPNSQSSVVAMGLLFLGFALRWFYSRRKSGFLSGFQAVCIIISLISNLISVFWGINGVGRGAISMTIDRLLSSRFSIIHKTYQYYGISFWGQKVITGKIAIALLGKYLNGDNSYVIMLIRYGVPIYFLFSIAYIVCMYRLSQSEQFFLVILFTVFALYGMMENNFFSLTYNIFLLLFSDLVYDKKRTREAISQEIINSRRWRIIIKSHNV